MRTYNMKKIVQTGVLILLLAVCVSSCRRLNEYNPASLSEDNVLRNYNGWKAFQSNIYTALKSETI